MSPAMPSIDEQVTAIMRGTDFGDDTTRQTMERELRERLAEGRPLRVYCGYDPTSVDLHLGHTLTMRKLRTFQDLGHEVTFLIGNFTGLVGDPSDKDKTRPMLTPEQLAANAETYADQAFRILDRDRTSIRYNADWLGELGFAEVVRLAANFTVAQFLERDNFARRRERGDPIYVSEFMYALMQAYDAVALETDVQVGGSEQLFNLMAGRVLQREHGQRPQIVVTLPILVGTDGRLRMSKSTGNYIGIDDAPNEMFGKVMSVPDDAMRDYFTLLTDLDPAEIGELHDAVEAGSMAPIDAKKRLARRGHGGPLPARRGRGLPALLRVHVPATPDAVGDAGVRAPRRRRGPARPRARRCEARAEQRRGAADGAAGRGPHQRRARRRIRHPCPPRRRGARGTPAVPPGGRLRGNVGCRAHQIVP